MSHAFAMSLPCFLIFFICMYDECITTDKCFLKYFKDVIVTDGCLIHLSLILHISTKNTVCGIIVIIVLSL